MSSATYVVALPVSNGQVGHGWGRAATVAIAVLNDDVIDSWAEHDVRWDLAHDEGTEGSHHARIVRFLLDHKVSLVTAGHMGDGMQRTLARMQVPVVLGAAGDARNAAIAAVKSQVSAR